MMLVQVFSVRASVKKFNSVMQALDKKTLTTTVVVRFSPMMGPR